MKNYVICDAIQSDILDHLYQNQINLQDFSLIPAFDTIDASSIVLTHKRDPYEIIISINAKIAVIEIDIRSSNFSLLSKSIPFADPNCINNTINIIINSTIQNEFMDEYNSLTMVEAIRAWHSEKVGNDSGQ